ncbi:MAG: hypothetical protein GXP62_19510 [Oligoflexia bacterium]|nr:hypothetical protein [Oligoflexia bacterium]
MLKPSRTLLSFLLLRAESSSGDDVTATADAVRQQRVLSPGGRALPSPRASA